MQYEMIRYILGGVCTTLVNVGMFSLQRYGVGLELQVANGISILTAILFAFGINRTFVFQKEGKAGVWKEWMQFVGMRTVSMGAELWGMYLLTEKCHIPEFVCKVLLQGLIIGMNYGISKCYIFKIGGVRNEEDDCDRTMFQ